MTSKHRMEGHAKAEELSKQELLMDGLSSPLTVCTLYLHNLIKVVGNESIKVRSWINTKAPLHLVVIGASAAHEEVRRTARCFLRSGVLRLQHVAGLDSCSKTSQL